MARGQMCAGSEETTTATSTTTTGYYYPVTVPDYGESTVESIYFNASFFLSVNIFSKEKSLD